MSLLDKSVFQTPSFDVVAWINQACEECPEGEQQERCYSPGSVNCPLTSWALL